MPGYEVALLPYQKRPFGEDWLFVSGAGDHVFLNANEASLYEQGSVEALPLTLQARLKAGFFTRSENALGTVQLLESRKRARAETLEGGPSLHIIVPTLQCAHSCQYCQVSRAQEATGFALSSEQVLSACASILETSAATLTVEFQGGDPLVRFDLIELAINRLELLRGGRPVRYVVASSLHQLDSGMCDFFRAHQVFLSTSIDGPAALHNRNRPIPGRNSYERTVAGLELAREFLGSDAVSALMTTTKASLAQPEQIVDEYVRLGFNDIFIRPLSSYGFAKRNQALLGYSVEAFMEFYLRALERVIYWNRRGVQLREVYASIVLNKLLSPFDGGYVDLQSPTGAGRSVVVYNYDGFVYPSDEARMLAETGDVSLRLGRIGMSRSELERSPVQLALQAASLTGQVPGCDRCAYQTFCAPDPVDAQAQYGSMNAPVLDTEHCRRHMGLFDFFFTQLRSADPELLNLFHEWANPADLRGRSCAK